MAIPDYQSLMLPVLRIAGDGALHQSRAALDGLGVELGLSDAELTELLPSGTSTYFASRVGWARSYLKAAGLLVSPRRGTFQITESGKAVLARNPTRIDNEHLMQYESFRAFRARSRTGDSEAPASAAPEPPSELTPEDAMAQAYARVRRALEADLLEQVKSASPTFFEQLVVDLLVAMGYGGSRQDAGRAVGRGGDGGIDGIIKEDRLGLDVIYVQAKRWEGTVGRPEIQKFAGALQGQRANKGVFITTSSFSRDARDYAESIISKIILLDGETLATLMVDHNVGVNRTGVYELKAIDSDYFEGA